MKAELEDIFAELGFKKCRYKYPFGEMDCFRSPDGCFYRIDEGKTFVAVERAGNEDEAKRDMFEDWDMYARAGRTDQEICEMIRAELKEIFA